MSLSAIDSTLQRMNAEKVRIIACGAIAREILAVKEANGLDHIDLKCLPALWHVWPDRIAPAMHVHGGLADG